MAPTEQRQSQRKESLLAPLAHMLLQFVRAVGDGILPSWTPIVERRRMQQFSDAQRQWQLLRRGRCASWPGWWPSGVVAGYLRDCVRRQAGMRLHRNCSSDIATAQTPSCAPPLISLLAQVFGVQPALRPRRQVWAGRRQVRIQLQLRYSLVATRCNGTRCLPAAAGQEAGAQSTRSGQTLQACCASANPSL